MPKTICIIGAGAAGLLTAATILERGESIYIHIYEKNIHPWKKILISGGGRCNVTTGIYDKKILSTKYTRGWEFLKYSMWKFSPKKCYEWFESHWVRMKNESDNRVFPVSDDGADVVGVFTRIFATYPDYIATHYGEGVMQVEINNEYIASPLTPLHADREGNNKWTAHTDGICSTSNWNIQKKYTVHTEKWVYTYDAVVITTGGNAYSHTGSTGDGYAFARSLGHTITPLGPSLSSFLTDQKWLHTLSGISFESARIEYIQEKEKMSISGSILLTHFGISGPLAFMLSSHIAFYSLGKWNTYTIRLAPISSMGYIQWDTYLKDAFAKHPKKYIQSILSDILPRKFADMYIDTYYQNLKDTYASSISRADRESIAQSLGDGISIALLERRAGDEFVTAGGVCTSQIHSDTMESRIHSGLYFAGEVVNVDGVTGGFNLHACWAMGYVAGSNI